MYKMNQKRIKRRKEIKVKQKILASLVDCLNIYVQNLRIKI